VSTWVMSFWNVAGALVSPNGMTIHSYEPYLVRKLVYSRASSSIATPEEPDAKSSAARALGCSYPVHDLSIRGRGPVLDSCRSLGW
jgi:hypothetical protein